MTGSSPQCLSKSPVPEDGSGTSVILIFLSPRRAVAQEATGLRRFLEDIRMVRFEVPTKSIGYVKTVANAAITGALPRGWV